MHHEAEVVSVACAPLSSKPGTDQYRAESLLGRESIRKWEGTNLKLRERPIQTDGGGGGMAI